MGKVHGSLARAGKVRGQTPKVAKQDKKKKPRGRAHKRLQYNRRFVTAVVGFGKKRGPNSSEKLDYNCLIVSSLFVGFVMGKEELTWRSICCSCSLQSCNSTMRNT
ncbi:40S ribosomal protein S30 [Pyrus ussuriensis x Pyrus communis]|uniref:40S ribosomal protein S30 n=10 Tax=Mesangiospermae TaxID=1437183 RepID=A0A5N5GWC4_9ROSA|nr:40S ribosomal protein S30 [Pyrus ussuriensis x Pyrus communis]